MNKLEKIIEDAYNLQNEINKYKGNIENTKRIYELLIYSKKLNNTLNNLINCTKANIKKYCVEETNLSIQKVNEIIENEKHMNLQYLMNKDNNFSCKYCIKDNENKYIRTKTILELIDFLDKETKVYNYIKIKEFRCKDYREQYVQIINTFIILSKLKQYNINLK